MICRVEGCDKEQMAKGYCSNHYYKLRRYGDPTFSKYTSADDGKCLVDNCDIDVLSQGYCSKHYYRLNKYGDPTFSKLIKTEDGKCLVDGCDNNISSHGYCPKHHYRFKKYGDATYTNSQRHRLSGTKIYNIWRNMVQRCYNPIDRKYKNYGGRGISVCQRWRDSVLNFYKDVGDCPSGMQFDRIDNDGNYEPNNWKWSTPTENNRHRTDTALNEGLVYEIMALRTGGHTYPEISDELGVDVGNVGSALSGRIFKEIQPKWYIR